MSNDIDWPLTPITEQTCKRQKWERYDEVETLLENTLDITSDNSEYYNK